MTRLNNREAARYLSGRSTPEERRSFDRWLEENPEHRRTFETVAEIWQMAENPTITVPSDEDFVRRDWERVAAAIGASGQAERNRDRRESPRSADRVPTVRRVRRTSSERLAFAAAFVFLVAAGVWLAMQFSEKHGGAALADLQEVSTSPGQRARIPLGDGTIVHLNVASTLRFPEPFVNGERALILDGEAFFEVTEDAVRPFVVHAADAVVEVVGTKFAVRAYDDSDVVDVVVSVGEVVLRNDGPGDDDELVLTAHQKGRLAEGVVHRLDGDVNVQRHLAWMESRLILDDVPLREVAVELRRWYALDVRIADPEIAELQLTAEFRSEPVHEILNVIAASLDVSYERDKQTVTFYR